MPEVGDLIDGRYRLVRRIAEGGMGVVYEATHERLGKQVAIKFLLEQFAEVESTAYERFEQEARVAVAIGHRSIVDINDFGTSEDNVPYIVMELLRGQALASLLAKEEDKRLEVPLACHVICQVLSALVYAHRMGVIHRDLKPDNVFLLDSEIGLPEVKLLDFGISKVRSLEGMDTAKTKSGVVLGTPDYMSPEQARGERDLDQRIDIYAVGALLYECIAGRSPFEADNYNALLMKIALEEPTPLPELVEDLPKGLVAVIDKALSREKEDRYSSALEMLHALAPFADQSFLPPELNLAAEEGEEGDRLSLKPTVGATPAAKRSPTIAKPEKPRSAWITILAVVAALATMTVVVVVIMRPPPETSPDGGEAGSTTPAHPPPPSGDSSPTPAADGGPGDASSDGSRVDAADDADAPAGETPRRPGVPPWRPPPRGDGGAAGVEDAAPVSRDGNPRRDGAIENAGADVVFQPEFR